MKKRTVDRDTFGSEPILESYPDGVDITNAYNWYNYMHGSKKSLDHVVEFMKNSDYPDDEVQQVANLNYKSMITLGVSVGWIARIMTNGTELPFEMVNKVSEGINHLLEISHDIPTRKRKSPQVSTLMKSYQYIDMLDDQKDDDLENKVKKPNIYGWLVEHGVKGPVAVHVMEHYKKVLEEIDGALNKTHKDLVEAYHCYSKAELKYMSVWFNTLIAACDKLIKGSTRKRKKKVKTARQQTIAVQYQKDDPKYKVVSVEPVKLVGASEVWLFNTRYKKLTVLYTGTRDGFTVKGTTVYGFDPDKSITKIVRKPEVILKRVWDGGSIIRNKIMKELKTKEQKAVGRINSDTLLVRIIK